MLFNDYMNNAYIVEEISPEQVKYLLAQQILDVPGIYDSFLERNYSYRTNLNSSSLASEE